MEHLSYIQVAGLRRITPRMARITFTGADLPPSDEPDRQVKLYFPRPGQAAPVLPELDGDVMSWYQAFNEIPESDRPWMRSFTLRGADPIVIDFVLHGDEGPASSWALGAEPGDTLAMFGPSDMFARGKRLSESIGAAGWLLIAGDETALPAVGTLMEWLPPGARAIAYLEVASAAEEQLFDTRGSAEIHWLHRDRGERLVDALPAADLPSDRVFAWLAGESGAVRTLRRHLVDDRGVAKRSIDFAGYWRARLTQDDAPTQEDLSDAQELLAMNSAPPAGT